VASIEPYKGYTADDTAGTMNSLPLMAHAGKAPPIPDDTIGEMNYACKSLK
jgi:hypothetical protein